MVQAFKSKPIFICLLPLFFILHGFILNYNSIGVGDASLLTLFYFACTITIAGICWIFYRDITKASLIAFVLIATQFLFGNIQDTLKRLFPGTIIWQYRFILPVGITLFAVMLLVLKKRKKSLLHLNQYLNILFLILIIIDAGWLVIKATRKKEYITINNTLKGRTIPGYCAKPDIYLLLMDQYAGNKALKEIYGFDNAGFLDELKSLGFYVAGKSSSNYNLTPFSMASLLSMNFLSPEMSLKTKLNVSYCYQVIRNSTVIRFLTQNGYHFSNFSVFDFPNQPAREYKSFLPYGNRLITLNTFTGRLGSDIQSSIIEGKFNLESARKKIAYEHLHFNDSIFKFTINEATQKTNVPKFVYSHFMLPHFPYYYDSKGTLASFKKLTIFKETNSNDYIEYLQYGNKKILQLVKTILAASKTPPVIMVLSDHGCRNPGSKDGHTNDFLNLNAVYIPGKNYSEFYDSITNVNQFRVLFNTCFNQQLPLLKDSTTDVKN